MNLKETVMLRKCDFGAVLLVVMVFGVCSRANTDNNEWLNERLGGNWQRHTVVQYEPKLLVGDHKYSALYQNVTENYDEPARVPYLVYMPEIDRVAMLLTFGASSKPHLSFSDDGGATWTKPKIVREDIASGLAIGLAYLGEGKLMFSLGEAQKRYFSDDYGETWEKSYPMPEWGELPVHEWDPPFIDRDPKTGKVKAIYSTGYQGEAFYAPYFLPDWACLRISKDMGESWSENYFVPQWKNLNEITIVRAANGDLVAACRTAFLEDHRYRQNVQPESDHYSGLAVSISKDDGKTWSDAAILYRWGRHHASMVVMENGDIVMSHVIRKGLPIHPSGHDQYGVGAIVSHDNGQTWELNRNYILSKWSASTIGKDAWQDSPQATSTVLLKDGDLLTAFGIAHKDVGVVRWHYK
jgi:hypothetical protein